MVRKIAKYSHKFRTKQAASKYKKAWLKHSPRNRAKIVKVTVKYPKTKYRAAQKHTAYQVKAYKTKK